MCMCIVATHNVCQVHVVHNAMCPLDSRQTGNSELNRRSAIHELQQPVASTQQSDVFNPLMGTGNYSATSNNRKLVHWPFMGGLLRLVQQGGDWARLQLAQSLPRCTKCNSTSVNCRCTNRRQWTTNMEQSASRS